jgi:UMF1 family MFS transporter
MIDASARSTMKLTSTKKRWIVYDVGNSAFVLLSTAVVPSYANSLLHAAVKANIVSTWGYAQTIGSIADVQGMKIRFFPGFSAR